MNLKPVIASFALLMGEMTLAQAQAQVDVRDQVRGILDANPSFDQERPNRVVTNRYDARSTRNQSSEVVPPLTTATPAPRERETTAKPNAGRRRESTSRRGTRGNGARTERPARPDATPDPARSLTASLNRPFLNEGIDREPASDAERRTETTVQPSSRKPRAKPSSERTRAVVTESTGAVAPPLRY